METTCDMPCYGCGSSSVTVMYNPKYSGFRGQCDNCGSNWPES